MTETRIIKCKECGAGMPAGAVFCDKCGASLSSYGEEKKAGRPKEAKPKSKTPIVAATVILIIAFVISGLVIRLTESGNIKTDDSDLSFDDGFNDNLDLSFDDRFEAVQIRVTPEQYEALSYGMSYSEVVEMLGEEGAMYYTNDYLWPGVYFGEPEYSYRYESPYIEIEFSDNKKIIGIREHNLLDAEQILKNRKQEKSTRITIDDEKLSSLKNGMSYEEVSEKLGEMGILIESESDKKGYSVKTYEWRYRKENDPPNNFFSYLNIRFVDGKAQRDSYSIWGK